MNKNKRFTHALVRKPGQSMIKGITTSNEGAPDHELARIQHQHYINVLKQCGLDVIELDALEDFPDSTFVEDVAVCTRKCAIITNPGAESRNKEISYMQPVLENYFKNIEFIQEPGTLDGGDVMMVGDHYYIGLSERTNRAGAGQLIDILSTYGYTGSIVEIEGILHLKTGMSYMEDNIMLVHNNLADHPEFESFTKIIVPPEEAYAANAIRVNDFVLLPANYPLTAEKLRRKGLKVIELPMSEFRKLDGGLSCLSLRW